MNPKKVLIIQGHPDSESFNAALQQAYRKGLEMAGHEIQEIEIGKLDFNPNLAFAYRKRTELEPDLLRAQAQIKWAEHIVLFFPVWWGSMPGLLKGFFDRVLLPGFAFQKRENSVWWDRFLKGRSGRIVSTLDQPGWYYRFNYFRPSYQVTKRMIFHFVGIRPVRTTTIGPIRFSKPAYREKWLRKMEKLGKIAR
ncbi:MAG TPA: flavodoxin family protein [Bacteroidetes bacterium]|nr:flavodoxin family protein [Bacteroidota bacterium]